MPCARGERLGDLRQPVDDGPALHLDEAGLQGRAVVATDALVSIATGIVKTASFQAFGALPLESWIMAAVIGVAGTPGAFLAKRLTEDLSLRVHNALLEIAIVAGGLILIAQGLRG